MQRKNGDDPHTGQDNAYVCAPTNFMDYIDGRLTILPFPGNTSQYVRYSSYFQTVKDTGICA